MLEASEGVAILAVLANKELQMDYIGLIKEMKEFAKTYGIFTTFCFFSGLILSAGIAWHLPDLIQFILVRL